MNRYIQEANQQFISAYNRYPIIFWDFCREIRLQESSGCSGPGGIFRKSSALS